MAFCASMASCWRYWAVRRRLMISMARAMPSAWTMRFCFSFSSMRISVCFRSSSWVAAILRETASATTSGYWILPTTTLVTWKGVSRVRSSTRRKMASPTGVMRSLISSPFSRWISSRAHLPDDVHPEAHLEVVLGQHRVGPGEVLVIGVGCHAHVDHREQPGPARRGRPGLKPPKRGLAEHRALGQVAHVAGRRLRIPRAGEPEKHDQEYQGGGRCQETESLHGSRSFRRHPWTARTRIRPGFGREVPLSDGRGGRFRHRGARRRRGGAAGAEARLWGEGCGVELRLT